LVAAPGDPKNPSRAASRGLSGTIPAANIAASHVGGLCSGTVALIGRLGAASFSNQTRQGRPGLLQARRRPMAWTISASVIAPTTASNSGSA
jgi:hypothetical protein